jgi:hypothetical protein
MSDVKKQISADWLAGFPELIAFNQNKLYKIVGCCIVGIELISLPGGEAYRPHFVVYPLWKKSVKSCLDYPCILLETTNKKGLQYDIPYQSNRVLSDDAVDSIKVQIPFSLVGNESFHGILKLVDKSFEDVTIRTSMLNQVKLFDLKFHALLYVGYHQQAAEVLDQMERECKNISMFELRCGDFDLWLESRKSKLVDRQSFLDAVELNKEDKKVSKLRSFELFPSAS